MVTNPIECFVYAYLVVFIDKFNSNSFDKLSFGCGYFDNWLNHDRFFH